MANEAQRLIAISLTKIAQSRSHRGGVSLHKNLLVATVLQKARYIFMEEAYMAHYQSAPSPQAIPAPSHHRDGLSVDDLVGLTAEEAGLDSSGGFPEDIDSSSSSSSSSSSDSDSGVEEFFHPTCIKCAENQQDKENHPPYANELTYLDLDKSSQVLRERSNSSSSTTSSSSSSASLKRRRAVAEWETEEAVQSILPKRSRQDGSHAAPTSTSNNTGAADSESDEDSVFLDDAALLSDAISKEVQQEAAEAAEEKEHERQKNNNGMEIDHITSLVSIWSFSMGSGGGGASGASGGANSDNGKLNRSVSTPDLCAAQAKDTGDTLQQRPFLAMTV